MSLDVKKIVGDRKLYFMKFCHSYEIGTIVKVRLDDDDKELIDIEYQGSAECVLRPEELTVFCEFKLSAFEDRIVKRDRIDLEDLEDDRYYFTKTPTGETVNIVLLSTRDLENDEVYCFNVESIGADRGSKARKFDYPKGCIRLVECLTDSVFKELIHRSRENALKKSVAKALDENAEKAEKFVAGSGLTLNDNQIQRRTTMQVTVKDVEVRVDENKKPVSPALIKQVFLSKFQNHPSVQVVEDNGTQVFLNGQPLTFDAQFVNNLTKRFEGMTLSVEIVEPSQGDDIVFDMISQLSLFTFATVEPKVIDLDTLLS